MAKRQRADQLLFDSGQAESREMAKRLIMAGLVFQRAGASEERVDKPGKQLPPDIELFVKEQERFVSRGGHKLLTAIEHWDLNLSGVIALDAGASTGGFTDCMLQFGAARVYAVDVGYGQLHQKLRTDPRVVNMEKVNLRLAQADLIPEPVDFVTADVSFISLTQVLPPILRFMGPKARAVVLIKPQFEVGPGRTDKGVVRDEALRMEVVERIIQFAREELSLECRGFVPSKIKGPKGNQEYLALFERV